MPLTPGQRPRARVVALVGGFVAVLGALVVVFGGDRLRDGRSLVLPGRGRPDELPVMLNSEPPFRYPAPLYAEQVQGNVMLRIFIDREGRVRPESTRVMESSGYPSLDSSAVTGSQDLHFAPARVEGEPIAVSIRFPVFFRHPDAPPLPGDSILRKR